ncbi:hypothetical protein GGR50DRAFT_698930 [Xylaria sp. CBS 124048]|nr:hypothetical protein GGR50DRAFT_698930 [Xylaria sp. CBS 124048]
MTTPRASEGQPASSTRVILHSPGDFSKWEVVLKGKAGLSQIWEHLRPEQREPWPPRPEAPRFADFPHNQANRRREIGLQDLTEEGHRLYASANSAYQVQLNGYNSHRKAVKEVGDWMLMSIADDYREAYIDQGETIDVWYDKIRALGETARRALMFQYKIEYETYINAAVGKVIKDFPKWIDEWAKKVARAQTAGADLQDSFRLVTDLERALLATAPSSVSSFRAAHSTEIGNNTLSLDTISSELRQEAVVIQSARKTTRTVRGGAFNTFEPGEQEEEAPASSGGYQGSHHQRRMRGGRASSSVPRKRSHSDTRTESERDNPNVRDCIVCFGRHPIRRCWYVFPKIAPHYWYGGNKREATLVEDRMKNNEEVKKAVEQARQRFGDAQEKIEEKTPEKEAN